MVTWGCVMPWWQGLVLLVINTKKSDFPLRYSCQGQSYSCESTTAVTPFVKKVMCLYNRSFSQEAEKGRIRHLTAVLHGSSPADRKRYNKVRTCFWPTDNSNCTKSIVHCKFQHVTLLSLQVLPMFVKILLYLVCHIICPIGKER
jgi:hypothetical protein